MLFFLPISVESFNFFIIKSLLIMKLWIFVLELIKLHVNIYNNFRRYLSISLIIKILIGKILPILSFIHLISVLSSFIINNNEIIEELEKSKKMICHTVIFGIQFYVLYYSLYLI